MSLRNYLQAAYKRVHLDSEAALATFQAIDATLQPDHENLILFYIGSFNPPHRGHIDVLLSGLRPEVGAMAIVIVPSEDYLLRHKMAKHTSDFFLSAQRRAEIWETIPSIPKDKVWVWMSTYFALGQMVQTLLGLMEADGHNLAFAHMMGPDNVSPRDPFEIVPIFYPRILVTDKARCEPAHFLPSGKPIQWVGFEEWTCTERGSGIDVARNDEREVMLWICKSIAGHHEPEKTGYYLHFAKSNPVDVTSTAVRDDLLSGLRLDETELNQLSTPKLMELLAPVLSL